MIKFNLNTLVALLVVFAVLSVAYFFPWLVIGTVALMLLLVLLMLTDFLEKEER